MNAIIFFALSKAPAQVLTSDVCLLFRPSARLSVRRCQPLHNDKIFSSNMIPTVDNNGREWGISPQTKTGVINILELQVGEGGEQKSYTPPPPVFGFH